jgi:hypothetical protein
MRNPEWKQQAGQLPVLLVCQLLLLVHEPCRLCRCVMLSFVLLPLLLLLPGIQKLHIRTVPLGEQPRRIAHQPSSKSLGVVTISTPAGASPSELAGWQLTYLLLEKAVLAEGLLAAITPCLHLCVLSAQAETHLANGCVCRSLHLLRKPVSTWRWCCLLFPQATLGAATCVYSVTAALIC